MAIQYLSIHKKIIEGKTVSSSAGLRNKIKHYLFGYPLVQRTYLCEKCGTPMALEKTDDKGTQLQASSRGVQVRQNMKMPFNWLYFTCPKCGWGRVTTDQ